MSSYDSDQRTDQFKELQSLIRTSVSSISGKAVELPVELGLAIDDFGPVILPINNEVAENLIKMCKPASNNESIFQLDPISIKIENPDWELGLAELVERVADGFGYNGKINANFSKLVVCGTGSHFINHNKNIFGTLKIKLPSIHQDDGKAHFSAHLSNVEHEIISVKSGYQLVLVYNLVLLDGANNRDLIGKMTLCLTCLNKSQYQLATLLDRKYSETSLRKKGVKALKGVDYERYNLLKNANDRLPMEEKLSFYIAKARNDVGFIDEGGNSIENLMMYDYSSCVDEENCEWELDDNIDREITIEKWFNMNGVSCFEEDAVDFDFFTKIIDPNDKENIFIDSENELSWGETDDEELGNNNNDYGLSKTSTYYKYLLVFWPKKYDFNVATEFGINYVIDNLYKNLESDFDETNFKFLVKQLIDSKNYSIKTESVKKVLFMFEKYNDLELCKRYLNCLSFVPAKELAKLIFIYSWNDFKNDLVIFSKPSLKSVSLSCDLIKVNIF